MSAPDLFYMLEQQAKRIDELVAGRERDQKHRDHQAAQIDSLRASVLHLEGRIRYFDTRIDASPQQRDEDTTDYDEDAEYWSPDEHRPFD